MGEWNVPMRSIGIAAAVSVCACTAGVDIAGHDDDPVPVEPGGEGGSADTSGGGEGSTAPPTCLDALSEVQACLSVDMWVSHGMGNLASAPTSDAECEACHGSSTTLSLFLSSDARASVAYYRDGGPYRMFPFLTCPLDAQERWTSTPVPSHRLVQKSQDPCPPNPSVVCHPSYELSAADVAAVTGFVDDLLSRWAAGSCAE